MLKDKIREKAAEWFEEVVALRRHFHRHPELSFEEKHTADHIAYTLRSWDIACQTGWGGHGVVAVVEGRDPERCTVALRADMDALPIAEANELPYKSENPGVMHACGHDTHTASLLGAARLLREFQSDFVGSVKLIFQPGEEKLPGGASLLIADGVLRNDPAPAVIIGQHVSPELPTGTIGLREGKFMASADEIYFTVRGRGGHAAAPHQCIDPVFIASQIVVELQHIVSRRANPITPSVLTFGKIQSAGGATNVIPDAVSLEGTFRTMDERWRKEALQLIEQNAVSIAAAMGGRCEANIIKGYPCLENNAPLTRRVRSYISEYLGDSQVVDIPVRLSAEDFAFYALEIPGCFYRLGTGNPAKGIVHPAHSAHFDVDEESLKTGTGLMAWIAIQELEWQGMYQN